MGQEGSKKKKALKLLLASPPIVLMAQFLFALIISISLWSFVQEKEVCGVNRWGVKTLTDPEASKVRLRSIKTTIDSLRSIKPNRKIGATTPRFGAEFYSFQLNCGIREYSNEEDGDIHLILYDLKDTLKTFVAEIPDPKCPAVKDSKYASRYQKARDEFAKYKLPKKKVVKGEYRITGVFFFDKKHGVKGESPNGAEIHPVLTIKKMK